jgi:PEP-CTERM motif-containing protein
MKKLFLLMLVLSVACSASAAIVGLDDSQLQSFVNFGWNSSTLDLTTDLAPGTQFDVTWAATGGWSDIAIGMYNDGGIGLGDTWEQEFYNPSSTYVTVYLFMQVDGWNYNQSGGVHVPAGATQMFSMLNPATTNVDSVGIKLGTDSGWMARPDGGSGSIQVIPVVPEPATMVLLGLGGLVLRRKR